MSDVFQGLCVKGDDHFWIDKGTYNGDPMYYESHLKLGDNVFAFEPSSDDAKCYRASCVEKVGDKPLCVERKFNIKDATISGIEAKLWESASDWEYSHTSHCDPSSNDDYLGGWCRGNNATGSKINKVLRAVPGAR
ncbi:MAG: hypothetical protein HQK84_11860 [Nitrospinae bacterium]|nr:hypothetical protein [Nitrospinota bacterium]